MNEQHRDDQTLKNGEQTEETQDLTQAVTPEETTEVAIEETPDERIDEGGSESSEESTATEAQPPSAKALAFHERLLSGEPRVQLTGMYENWFLDYASYVILERAVPHLQDGLKPVQRRILHTMKELDDGWYNKVANIIGQTMKYHPHGDASIGDALVQLGQKELLIDTQGNWGNILTGDSAAAPRYIEARLSKFALDVLFNHKTTDWMRSYDGRNQEPITLPVKFPLLLAQGAEGIAVGLKSMVLPHNFNELLDAAVAYLRGEPFVLYPDFLTGGLVDCSKYSDGHRGGVVKVRARIQRQDLRTLVISEIPYGKDSGKLIDSIRKASESGKIKIRKIEDNTAATAEIVVHVAPDVSVDKTLDALYAFTDCEISIWPNACVIYEDRPHFLSVSDILRYSVDSTQELLRRELEIRAEELEAVWHFASLERLFIEKRLYLAIEECETWEGILETIDESLKPYHAQLRRPVTREDIVKLTEIKIKRISKYDIKKADELLCHTEEELATVADHLAHLVEYTIAYYEGIKAKYGTLHPRHTEVTNFETIEATRVVATNKKLYVDRAGGFFGTELKGAEFVAECSDIDEVIVILKDGRYMISVVSDKRFFDKDILYINVFNRNDQRTIYNVIYTNAREVAYVKRCAITGVIRDKEYNLTNGEARSKILYMSVNPNGEAECVHVRLSGALRLRNTDIDFDFGTLAIKGRDARGNILTKLRVASVKLKSQGLSTLGGIKIWIDRDIDRLNTEERGTYLGEFSGADLVAVFYANGTYQTTSFDLSTRFGENILRIEKFNPGCVYSLAFWDAEQGFYYLKRFSLEESEAPRSLIGEHADSRLVLLSAEPHPRLEIRFGGKNQHRAPEEVDVEGFIGVKGYKARGKRLTTYEVDRLEWLPAAVPDPSPTPDVFSEETTETEE